MTSYEIRAYVNELSKFIRDKFYSDFKTPKVEFTIKPFSMIAGKAFWKYYPKIKRMVIECLCISDEIAILLSLNFSKRG